jgi:hypothetical protein
VSHWCRILQVVISAALVYRECACASEILSGFGRSLRVSHWIGPFVCSGISDFGRQIDI